MNFVVMHYWKLTLLAKTKIITVFLFSQVISETDIGNMTKTVSRADQLRNYIRNSKTPTDKMDVIFVARIVDKLSHYVQNNDRVSLTGEQSKDQQW